MTIKKNKQTLYKFIIHLFILKTYRITENEKRMRKKYYFNGICTLNGISVN